MPMLCPKTYPKILTRSSLEGLVERSVANREVVKKYEQARGMVVSAEGRALILECPKCQKQFKAWNPRTIYCSEQCWLSKSIEEKFWEKVIKSETGCWKWVGAKRAGYPAMKIGPKSMVGTHVSWRIHHGVNIPKGKVIRHKCDNPECTRPDHLEIGDHKDNVHDCMRRGRFKPRPPKLKEDQVIAIRMLYSPEFFGYHRLGKLFGISLSETFHIVNMATWKNLPSGEELRAEAERHRHRPMESNVVKYCL